MNNDNDVTTKVKTYAVNCNDAWLNTEGDDISGSYVQYQDYASLLAESAEDKKRIAELEIEAKELIAFKDLMSKASQALNDGEPLNLEALFKGELASSMFAIMFAGEFKRSGATNFLELLYEVPEFGELTVTLQKVEGKTPGQRIAELEAYAEVEALGADKAAEDSLYWMKSCKDLEAQVKLLAAENAALKELIEQHSSCVAVCPNCSHEEPSETDDIVALYRSMSTPATNTILASLAERDADKEQIADLWQRALDVQSDCDASLHALLPDARYEHPDYGVSVSPLEQVARMVEDYRQRIAELEARTVSVKLPSPIGPEAAPAHYWDNGESMAYADGYNKATSDAKNLCAAAGIKLEAGE